VDEASVCAGGLGCCEWRLRRLHFAHDLSSATGHGLDDQLSSDSLKSFPHAIQSNAVGRAPGAKPDTLVRHFQLDNSVNFGKLNLCARRPAVLEDIVERFLRDPEKT
jgi:hypothetical protein